MKATIYDHDASYGECQGIMVTYQGTTQIFIIEEGECMECNQSEDMSSCGIVQLSRVPAA